jgi:mono/diheme cytochrome c family protein
MTTHRNPSAGRWPALLIAGLAAAFSAGCDRGGDGAAQVDWDFVETDDPARFLEFLTRQQGLPAGEYTLVAGTAHPGASGDFTITAVRDDGDTESFSGAWPDSGSGGTDAGSPANPDFAYAMPYSGGASFEIESDADTCLYLLDAGGSVMAGKDNGSACSHPERIERPASKINTEANASAYYEAIDPNGTRRTLADWIEANGFGEDCDPATPAHETDCEAHVVFRDTKDLGYGRDMHARRGPDGQFAVYVRNFRVDRLPGRQYTTLNLDAAVRNTMDATGHDSIRWHFISNAVEFSTYPYGAGEPREGGITGFATADGEAPLFTKFYTFRPDDVTDPDAAERRLDMIDLDGRGEKSMPGPCIACHGGTARSLLPDGDFPAPIPGGVPGDTGAQMQVIEVNTIEFSDVPGWQCEDVIGGIHFINQGVLSSYETVKKQYDGVPGYWQPDFAAELTKGWYDDAGATDPDDYALNPAPGDPGYDAAAECDRLTENFYDYVPAGWRPDPDTGSPPAGADDLFREVIAPNCIVCHARRGTDLGSDSGLGASQDIDFSTYERYISHASQTEEMVFHKGVMPLGLLNFDDFWDHSE